MQIGPKLDMPSVSRHTRKEHIVRNKGPILPQKIIGRTSSLKNSCSSGPTPLIFAKQVKFMGLGVYRIKFEEVIRVGRCR